MDQRAVVFIERRIFTPVKIATFMKINPAIADQALLRRLTSGADILLAHFIPDAKPPAGGYALFLKQNWRKKKQRLKKVLGRMGCPHAPKHGSEIKKGTHRGGTVLCPSVQRPHEK